MGSLPYETGSSCDFSNMDLDRALMRVLTRLPTYVEHGFEGYRTVLPGFEVGRLNTSGWNLLRQYGPAIPYCLNGSHMLQVDLVNKDDIVLSEPWRTCSGKEGSFNLRAEVSRFTVQFHVVTTGVGQAVKLSYVGATLPVSTMNIYLTVEGAGNGVKSAALVLSKVLEGIGQKMWNRHFFVPFRTALIKALE